MNIIIKLIGLPLSLILILSLGSCKNKIDSNIEELQNMEKKYVAACNAKDFDKAREIVAELQPVLNVTMGDVRTKLAKMEGKAADKEGTHGYSGSSSGKYWNEYYAATKEYDAKIKGLNEHWRYINEKEIYTLLAKPSPDGTKRILFLYNQYDANELPDMNDVVDVSLSMGDDVLPIKLIKSGLKPNKENIISAINNGNLEFIEIAVQKNPDFLEDKDIKEFYVSKNGKISD